VVWFAQRVPVDDQVRLLAPRNIQPLRSGCSCGRLDLSVPAGGCEKAAMECGAKNGVIAWQPSLADVHGNRFNGSERRANRSEYELVG
jgi:hypothetical protein